MKLFVICEPVDICSLSIREGYFVRILPRQTIQESLASLLLLLVSLGIPRPKSFSILLSLGQCLLTANFA